MTCCSCLQRAHAQVYHGGQIKRRGLNGPAIKLTGSKEASKRVEGGQGI